MKALTYLFAVIHGMMALFFAGASIVLITIAVRSGYLAVMSPLDGAAAQAIIEAMGLLTASVVALQISQTIIEEEVVRDADISAPTRVRRFMARFFVVVIVALGIEGLVATFKALREDMSQLLYASSLVLATGVLLAAWGAFIYLNRYAEELEPEAMAEAKGEDHKLK